VVMNVIAVDVSLIAICNYLFWGHYLLSEGNISKNCRRPCPVPCCCLLQEHIWIHKAGRNSLPLKLDRVVLYTPSENISKHTRSDSLNLKPPVALCPM